MICSINGGPVHWESHTQASQKTPDTLKGMRSCLVQYLVWFPKSDRPCIIVSNKCARVSWNKPTNRGIQRNATRYVPRQNSRKRNAKRYVPHRAYLVGNTNMQRLVHVLYRYRWSLHELPTLYTLTTVAEIESTVFAARRLCNGSKLFICQHTSSSVNEILDNIRQ